MITEQLDCIDFLVAPQEPALSERLRAPRAKIAASTQAVYDTLFGQQVESDERALRFAIASAVARTNGPELLTRFYAEQAAPAHGLDGALGAWVEIASTEPRLAGRERLAAMEAAGLSQREIVTIGQLVGFVAFQARVVAGLLALTGQPARGAKPLPVIARDPRFTSRKLDWLAWLAPLPLEAATPEQLAVLDESGPTARESAYYLTLVHEPEVLRRRSETYNAVMYAPGGLPRAEREMAALAVSIVNGCHYCASVHADRLVQLSKRPELCEWIFDDPYSEKLSARERAITTFAVRLTTAPEQVGAEDLAPLREQGLNDAQVLDLIHVSAIFAWANRLMLTLGEPDFS
jgi:uncharacterized peroxidase-related enzyme